MEITSRTQRSRLRQPAVLAWLRLARVFQKIDTRSERFFRTHELNTALFDILAQVGAARGMTQQELADQVGCARITSRSRLGLSVAVST